MQKIKKMKIKLTVVFFICFSSAAFAQWEPTHGPYSGEIHSVIKSNNEIIVGTKYIYKSSDDGKTWSMSNNGISGSVGYIRCIAAIGSNLVAGTDAGVFYSTDNGNNWTQSSGTSSLSVFSIVVKGTNLFLSTADNGIYKSTNNGTTWTAANTGISNITYMRALAVKGSDIYTATDGYGIYKSANDGSSWSLVNTGLPGSFYSVSSLAVVGNNIMAGTYGAGIYKSTNDGGNWSAVNNGVSSSDDILAMGVNGTSIYASTLTGNLYKTTDYSNWAAVFPGNFTATRFETFFSATNEFYTGTWGFGSPEQSYGLFRTTDDGTTWQQVGITDYPISVLEVSGNNVFAGTNDITGNSFRIPLFKTTESDTSWVFNMGGFAGKNITAMKANGATMYLFDDEGPGNSLVYRSTNNGNNWTSTGFNVLYNNFNTFVIAGSLIYAGDNSAYYTSSHVFVSSDNGATWNVINNGFTSSVHFVYALVLKGTALFVGTDDGVYKNTVGQNNWTAVSTGLTNMYVKSLVVSGNNIYAGTQGGGIFKSSNDGALWTDVSFGIPLFSDITCFATSALNIFAGTDNGVFSLLDGDTIWTNQNDGLLDSSITALTVSQNYLYAGTTGFGVWRRNLAEIITTDLNETANDNSFFIYPNPAEDEVIIETTSMNSLYNSVAYLYNIYGQLILSQFIQPPSDIIDISGLPQGTYLLKIFNGNIFHVKKIIKK